ncbi:toprim domain-containing protein [Paenilisteria rocourtiae]|uniref:Toprim domain-containing protein n=1 Tax=Listeria rocourtiae TaxID=647910 RepID=A0A4R6ZN75_9LIST|nr:toprim domain-containing protein [Listeria rocourtiae]EUJ42553.1 DNA primase [Listeria rocourtiae FSL F6-920]TDR53923.1 Toprim domain-containing protein [Listeria rocourtiae]
MQTIKINDQTVNVDIVAELADYDWYNARWTDAKLIAASPFRVDSHPSFFVNLEGDYAGVWGDSGALDTAKEKGNFVSLLANLRGWTYGMTADWLLEKYGFPDVEKLKLSPRLKQLEPLDSLVILSDMTTPDTSAYLESRGITADIQRLYGVGGDEEKAVMPWRTKDGLLANIKYRRVDRKDFWFEGGATPIDELVFGLDVVYRERPITVAINEAEIDAMSWCAIEKGGIGVAVGGSSLSDAQRELLLRMPVEEIILAGDNDDKGAKLNQQLKMELGGHFKIRYADYKGEKDANNFLNVN